MSHTSEKALPSSRVRDVLVDSKGVKWFATDNGLTKFDGKTWFTYQMAYQQLQNRDIYAIEEDLNGNIWIITAQDIEVYDGESWTYYSSSDGLYSGGYQSIKADKSGNIWLGHSQGITRYQEGEFKNINRINDQTIKDVRDIELDGAGNVWVSFLNAATNRANIAVFKDGMWQTYSHDKLGGATYPALKLSFADGKIWAGSSQQGFYYLEAGSFMPFEANITALSYSLTGDIMEDSSGNLWFMRGAAVGGVYKFDPVGKTWTKLELNNAALMAAGIEGNTIWFGCENSGVLKVDATTHAWQTINTTYGMSTSNITKIFMESPGAPWVGGSSDDKTSYFIDKPLGNSWTQLQHPFYIYNLISAFRDIKGKIWLVTSGSGAHVFDQGKWTSYTSTNSLLLSAGIIGSATDHDGNVYFTFQNQGTMKGTVIMFDGAKWYDITSSHSHLTGYISNIAVTSDKKVWFFSDKGTVVKEGSKWTTDETIPLYVQKVVADNNGGLWLGYWNKVVHYAAGKTTAYDLSELLKSDDYNRYEIRGLAIDFRGHVWAGGHIYNKGEDHPGLVRFDGTSWKTYTKADGLISDAVNTIEADALGNVWVGTQKGLSQLILFSEVVAVNTTNISCHGGSDGSIQLTPEGNNAPYQYSIDGGATFVSDNVFSQLAAGKYHVIVKDGKGNTAHDEIVELTQPAGVFTWEVTPVSCAGAADGAIKLTVQNNGAGISYAWHNADGVQIATTKDVTALAGGNYSVTVTYGDCSVTKQITVAEPTLLNATIEYLNSCGEMNGQITVRATGGTAPFKYSIDGGKTFQASRTFTALATGTYKVQVQDAKGCLFTSESVNIVQAEKPVPVIVATGNLALCAGTSIWLKTTQKFEGYEWYDGNGKLLSTMDSLEVNSAGNYYAVVYQNQCQATSNTLTTTVVNTYNEQTVCIVTVDAATRKNKIVWSKIDGKNIASYNIYRETGTNQFTLIGNVPYQSGNYFIDEASSPMTASERYSIAIVDVCGRESAKSPAHKTIYLQANLGINNSVNLSWDNYVGFSYTQVNVLRGSSIDNLQLLATRPANNNTFTDTSPNSEQMVYVIEAVTGYTCEENAAEIAPESSGAQLQNAATRSNPSSAKGVLGVEEDRIANAGLKIFPNPSAAAITIEIKPGKFIHQVRLLSIAGSLVQEHYIKQGKTSVLLERKAKPGIYILEVKDEQGHVYRQRVILQ